MLSKAKAFSVTQTKTSIEDSFQTIWRKARVVINKVTELFTRVSGRKTKKKGKENKYMETISFMRASGKMGISMAKDT